MVEMTTCDNESSTHLERSQNGLWTTNATASTHSDSSFKAALLLNAVAGANDERQDHVQRAIVRVPA